MKVHRVVGQDLPGNDGQRAQGIEGRHAAALAPAMRRILLGAFLATAALIAFGASPALATKTHFFLENFGSAAQPSFSKPVSIAVDQSNGDVLVIDALAGTVSRFNPDGTPDDFAALGTNIIDGQGLGDGTPQGALTFEGRGRDQVAVDSSGGATDGNIYVTQLTTGSVGESTGVVDVFSSTGAYLGQLSEYREGAAAGGASVHLSFVSGVAVATDGTVYVSDSSASGLIHKYVPSGSAPVNADNTANLSIRRPRNLAVGAGPTAGFLFVVSVPSETAPLTLFKVDASTGESKYQIEDHVEAVAVEPMSGEVYAGMSTSAGGAHGQGGFTQFDASGALGATLVTYVRPESQAAGWGISVRGSNGRIFVSNGSAAPLAVYGALLTRADIEVNSAAEVSATRARLRGFVNPDGVAVTECKFEYGTVASGAFSDSVPCEEPIPTDATVHSVSAVASGLSANGEYQYRLVVSNADGTTATSETETFDLLSRVATRGSTGVSSHSATVHGLVRPEGEAVEGCSFEYGPTTAYGANVPCSPAAGSIAQDFATDAVSGALEELDEDVVYHYRLSFTTAAGSFTGGDEFFRTREAAGPPDNRRYELVSPPDKNHSDVNPSLSVAALDGNRLVFTSSGSFAGAKTALASIGLQYLSSRGPDGWSTENLNPPGGELHSSGYTAFSPDLSKGALVWPENNLKAGTLDPNAQPGFNLYLREAGNPSFTLLNGTLDDAGPNGVLGSVVAASSDFSHLAIVSHNPLTPDAPAGTQQCEGLGEAGSNRVCTYEWDNGTLRLASILPGGEPSVGGPGSLAFARPCSSQHVISGDGSRLFFSSPSERSDHPQLYARENATTTTLISASERTAPGGLEGQPVDYQDAEAAHGNRVLFTTSNALVDEDTDETNDLYLYDYANPAGERLTLISEDENANAPAGAEVDGGPSADPCGGVMGVSEDLHRIYFVADNQIVPGEPEAAGPKLYLWDDSGGSPATTYLGTAASGDSLGWQGALTTGRGTGYLNRTAHVSGDGRYLALISSAKLTGYDNEGQNEVYRYDAGSHTMECASCREDAVPSAGEISFESLPAPLNAPLYGHIATNVTAKGQVFFQTTRGLALGDANAKMDVYEYENGHLRLISSGVGAANSFFLDATPSGSDVFFTTVDRLVGWDKDNNADAYDARVGGGFPEPQPSPPICEGDACQAAPNPPNDATPASSSFEGARIVTKTRPSRCPHGKVRRHGHCVKRRHSKKQRHAKKKHPGDARTATRSHG
jgi:hypothetical protein